jgi:hypothetical protein
MMANTGREVVDGAHVTRAFIYIALWLARLV